MNGLVGIYQFVCITTLLFNIILFNLVGYLKTIDM